MVGENTLKGKSNKRYINMGKNQLSVLFAQQLKLNTVFAGKNKNVSAYFSVCER